MFQPPVERTESHESTNLCGTFSFLTPTPSSTPTEPSGFSFVTKPSTNSGFGNYYSTPSPVTFGGGNASSVPTTGNSSFGSSAFSAPTFTAPTFTFPSKPTEKKEEKWQSGTPFGRKFGGYVEKEIPNVLPCQMDTSDRKKKIRSRTPKQRTRTFCGFATAVKQSQDRLEEDYDESEFEFPKSDDVKSLRAKNFLRRLRECKEGNFKNTVAELIRFVDQEGKGVDVIAYNKFMQELAVALDNGLSFGFKLSFPISNETADYITKKTGLTNVKISDSRPTPSPTSKFTFSRTTTGCDILERQTHYFEFRFN